MQYELREQNRANIAYPTPYLAAFDEVVSPLCNSSCKCYTAKQQFEKALRCARRSVRSAKFSPGIDCNASPLDICLYVMDTSIMYCRGQAGRTLTSDPSKLAAFSPFVLHHTYA